MATTPNPPINVPPINPTTGTFVNQWVQWFNLMYKNIGSSAPTDFVSTGDFDEDGYMVRTGTSSFTSRTIEGTDDEIVVTNGNGVNGPTTISIDPILRQSVGLNINNLDDIEDGLDLDNDYAVVYDTSFGGNKKVLTGYFHQPTKNYLIQGDFALTYLLHSKQAHLLM